MQKVKINSIKTNPKNPRLIKDDKFKKLVKSIQEFPQMLELRPIVVDENNIILGGNMRYKACIEAGLKEIYILKAEDLTEQQKDEFIVKDNVGFGEWDWDILANEWDTDKLTDWGLDLPLDVSVQELEAEEDDYEIPNEINTDIVLGDLFEIGEHRLLCGDSTQVDTWQKVMDDKLCDMVMTDPPYNVDYQGGTGLKIMNDKMENNTFYQFLYDFYTALGSYTKKGGAWYVWHADSEGANFRSAFVNSGLLLKQCLVWVKNSMVMGRQDYQWKHEPCIYGWKEGAAHYFTSERTHTTVIEDKLDIKKLTKDEMKKMLTEMLSDKTKSTIIHCDKPHRSAEHPTMKPILLLAPLIQNSSKENEIVADGFLGSGSTMVASHQLKRKCYGMELDPKYCQVIIDRMKKLDPSLEIKRNGITM
jgi:DNA modification methylase